MLKMSENSKKQNQKVAIYSMPALYQIDDLVRCEGDPFDNFVNFNIAFLVLWMKKEHGKLGNK